MNLDGMYRLCRDTVTVYHTMISAKGEFFCERRVLKGVYFDCVEYRAVDKSTSRPERGFLLVIPNRPSLVQWKERFAFEQMNEKERSEFFTLQPGDKVVEGIGKPIVTRAEWAALKPETSDGVAVVQRVDAKRFCGKVCHIECEGVRGYVPRTRRNG